MDYKELDIIPVTNNRGWTTVGNFCAVGRPYWSRCDSITAVILSLARITK